jgi:hypothetical protein
MNEEDLVGHQMTVQLNLGTGCNIFVPHHEVRRSAVLAIDLENEWPFAGVTTHPALSLTVLQNEAVLLQCDGSNRRWARGMATQATNRGNDGRRGCERSENGR